MKEKLTNNIVLKIVSVLVAIIVWLTVLNINDPDKTVTVSGIPVKVENAEAITSLGKHYTIESGETCKISVSGPRSIVDQLEAEDFTAVANIDDLSLTNSVPITVEVNKSSYKSKLDIEVKTTLKLAIEDIDEKEYEIAVEYSGKTADSYVVTGTSLSIGVVKVTAPVSQLNKIAKAVAVVNVSNKDADFTSPVSIKLLDNSGKEIKLSKDISLSISEVEASSTVLYKKALDIVCQLPDFINYDTLISGYELSVTSLNVVGRKDVLDTVESILIEETLEEYTDTDENIEIKYNVDDLLPEGVFNYTSTEEIILKVSVGKQESRTITTKANKISISDIPDGYEASLVTKGDITYTIRGPKELIDSLNENDIELKVSVENLQAGNHTLLVSVVLPDEIYQVGEISVEISLASKDDSNNPSENESNEPSSEENTEPESESSSEDESNGDEEQSTSEEEAGN